MPAALTFTATDWMTPQTVTVTGVNDAVDDGDQPYSTSPPPSPAATSTYPRWTPRT